MKDLTAWLEDIQSRHPKEWDLGLDRVGEVCRRLDLTKPAPQTILVAGTNGKGSTCEYLAQFCKQAGLSYGKTTSPYLATYNEQFEIDSELASDSDIISALEIIDEVRGDISLSYFEYGALIALQLFKQARVDVAILEIGLGGRLDAMNVVDPDVSIITRIALDHQDWLGNTRELIAIEKAGVMRAGKPVVILDEDPPAALKEQAQIIDAQLYMRNEHFHLNNDCLVFGEHCFDLAPGHLPQASAAAALISQLIVGTTFSQKQVDEVLAVAKLPGRFQTVEGRPTIILDVCHNPDAAEYLVRKLHSLGIDKVHIVAGIFADKDLAGVFQHLAPIAKSWHFASLSVDRGASCLHLEEVLSQSCGLTSKTYDKVSLAVDSALKEAEKKDTIIVIGSFVTVREALMAL